MTPSTWIAALMIFFNDGTFVEVRSNVELKSASLCQPVHRALNARTDWSAVAFRYGRVVRVVPECLKQAVDEIEL